MSARRGTESKESFPIIWGRRNTMSDQQKNVPREYYYDKYRGIDPIEASQRTGLAFDSARGRFELCVLGHKLYAEWPEYRLLPADEGSCPKMQLDFCMEIVAARYIIEGIDTPARGGFKAYRELPWGEIYDANFQGRCIKRLAYSFGTKLEKFNKAAEALSGIKLERGDAAFDMPFLGSVVCRLILWGPDDEFPPSAQFLFSDNAQFAFNAEDLAAVGDVVIGALKEVAAGMI